MTSARQALGSKFRASSMEKRRHNTRHAAAKAAAAVPSFISSQTTPNISKSEMYESFQVWALKTYGDSAKTKTITRRKYNRIFKILKGEEQTNAENSKFRFWVKAKGFRIGPPASQSSSGKTSDQVLYIPCSKIPNHDSERAESVVYKKVAVVENFYDIIYGVHVDMDGRGGKHAGQKRTYKAIAEMYSFLPREAVTHFLMSCTDCQKRMHLGTAEQKTGSNHDNGQLEESISSVGEETTDSLHIDYSLPITTTYLKHMRSLGYSDEEALNPDREDSEDIESEISEEPNTPLNSTGQISYDSISTKPEDAVDSPESQKLSASRQVKPMQWCQEPMSEEPINMIKGTLPNSHEDQSFDVSSCNGCIKREASSTPDNLSAGTKEEDDEDEDDDSDKIDINRYDPERLKAFNMFVRLFVDENLDRMVPISRQPKDKIQAIIDSCSRQFPEFGERARKRIRTYLKSCRRNKRTRENTNWEIGRNTQPHLTSALAEQILANACENESQNAKRMRLGLKPLSAEVENMKSEPSRSPQPETNILQNTLRHGKSSSLLNGSSAYSSNYRFVAVNGHASSVTNTNNGPTDLSMKKSVSGIKHSLNSSEITAVKQLIAGYRESAAFLLRSADELEQLLLQQN
ncbi:nucleolar protein 4 [Parasteatoda tepidariorum]|uniref:nucleolar protein 4 n=1 Tax=Parasteatoda tepidariorum TaxID=114398 RepID=UPI00077FA598|nr:nucleolar protein 4 [Parasteatoda tepidariorum]